MSPLDCPITLYRSGTHTPEGERVCADLELDPGVKHSMKLYRRRLARVKPGDPAPTCPTPPYRRTEAVETGHAALLTAAALLGIDVIASKLDDRKSDDHQDDSA